jgi:Ran GTPase-activating protein (RanGAP) involved in mRNA processing and transport
LNLLGYRLNEGICKALRIYLENFPNALTKINLDNNGMNQGGVLSSLLQGVQAQDDFKQIIIMRNTVDETSTDIIVNILQRGFPNCLEELRIINCKISSVSTHKILSSIHEGSS